MTPILTAEALLWVKAEGSEVAATRGSGQGALLRASLDPEVTRYVSSWGCQGTGMFAVTSGAWIHWIMRCWCPRMPGPVLTAKGSDGLDTRDMQTAITNTPACWGVYTRRALCGGLWGQRWEAQDARTNGRERLLHWVSEADCQVSWGR